MQGILFKPEMTLANLKGLKSRTSRLYGLKEINKNPDLWEVTPTLDTGTFYFYKKGNIEDGVRIRCPYGKVGSELYAKETYCIVDNQVAYKVSTDADAERCRIELGYKWSSPMMMKEIHSRYHIILNKIIAQRIQDISEEDCKKEGIEIKAPILQGILTFKMKYHSLWDSINHKTGHGWNKNEWVWGLFYDMKLKDGVKL